MTKATLEFNLPEETNEHSIAVKAMDYAIAWQEIKEFLRQKIKYCNNMTQEQLDLLDEIREYILNQEHDRQLPELG